MIFLFSLSVWYAWRYSRTEIDPDWAMFNLAGFTRAVYGRDFVDCKSPMIHLWYYGIYKGLEFLSPGLATVAAVRFCHHVLVSLPGVMVGGWQGLAFIVLVNSGWWLAFHGNVGQQAAGLILLALFVDHAWCSSILIFLAVAFEPKLVPALLVLPLSGWWLPFAAGTATSAGAALATWKLAPRVWGWLVEANLTIPRRMAKMRWGFVREGLDMTYTASGGLMYGLPWALMAVWNRPDWRYWLPAILYLALAAAGVAVRSNHYLALAGWLAWAMPAQAVMWLCIVDWVSAFGYLGDIWGRFYPGLANLNREARKAGEWLEDQVGSVWVNGIHTGVYIYARKRPIGGMCEQIEIRENAGERREKWCEAFRENPPMWVVQGMQPGWTFSGAGYEQAAKTNSLKIYEKAG